MPSKNMKAVVAVALLAGGLGVGCVEEGEPSPAYSQAQKDFNALYGREMEEAYLLPEMAEIEKLLESVPKESSDHQRAAEQLKRIRSGQERVQAQKAEREAELSAALAPSKDFEFSGAKEEAPAAAAVDAGVAVPVEGMKLAEFNARFGTCFASGKPVLLNNQGMRPTWSLMDQPDCREKFSGFADKILVGQDDALYVIADKSKVEIRVVDGGVPPVGPAAVGK
ncbi:MAG: hypothetical protein WBV82_26740 [Myxococcaceae bacterium]